MSIILFYFAVVLSCVSVVFWMIILWQYLTGRDYWGQPKNSFVFPMLLCGTIPFMNVMGVCVFVVGVLIVTFEEMAFNIRQKAIAKKKGVPIGDNGYGVVTEHDLD